jgi:hypothetical protein
MSKEKMDKINGKVEKGKTVLIILLSLGVVIAGIYKGVSIWGFQPELFGWIFTSICFALFLLGIAFIFEKVMMVWAKITDWFIPDIRKHPYLRMFLMIPNIIIGFYVVCFLFFPFTIEFTFKIIVAIYVIFVSPAVITSLIRDDLKKEDTVLAEKVSRAVRIDNPQAAIQNAFTHFEDHLNKRIQGGEKLFGNRLIKVAYEGENSKLEYKNGEKDHTQHLYQLMAGAYSILRNPHHHKIIEDGEDKAQAIISLAELMIEFVDASEDRCFEIMQEEQEDK